MSYQELQSLDEAASAFLAYSPPNNGQKYSLDRMYRLMATLDNPQAALRVVHVAGTSGKTSTAYFVRALLEATGQRTGLTVSPHIVAINERVQVGGYSLDTAVFLDYANQFLTIVRQTELQPTYFELLMALAYWVFAKEAVDYAVIETGLGGLLDSSNVATRTDKLCIITDIGLDHTEILGDTLSKIAVQKAGIAHAGNHVLIGQQAPEIMTAIDASIRRQQATLAITGAVKTPVGLPKYQQHNWSLATATYRHLQARDGLIQLNQTQLEQAATQTPPGRWENYTIGDKRIILDGAHNPQKLQALRDTLAVEGIKSVAALMNLSASPDAKVMAALDVILPVTSYLIIPEFRAGYDVKSRHSLPASELATAIQAAGYNKYEVQLTAAQALATLLRRPEKVLLVTGSLYLVSAVRPLILEYLMGSVKADANTTS